MTSPHNTTRSQGGSPDADPPSELVVIARMARVLVEEWDAEVVLRTLLREAAGPLGAQAVALWLTDPSAHHLSLAYTYGLPPIGGSAADLAATTAWVSTYHLDGPGLLGRAARAREPVTIRLDAPVSDADPLVARARAYGLAALLLVPLLARGRLLAVLAIGSRDGDAFPEGETRRVASVLADIFTLAIESTGLQERLRETNARLVTASIEAQQRAEELADEKEEREAFISLVAHELKNPLAVLKMHIALLQKGREDREKQLSALATMANNANKVQRLIDDLLDASRIHTGHFAIEPAAADLVSIARDVVEEQRATTQRHRVELLSDHDKLVCVCDRARMTQVLSNLVSNAIKYSPEGGDVIVRVASDGDSARLSVEDHGAGLSPNDLARLFEPYARILRVREAHGTGLGLFITKGIVEAHGGTISVASPGVGHGSTFTIVIPRTRASAGRPADGQDQEEEGQTG